MDAEWLRFVLNGIINGASGNHLLQTGLSQIDQTNQQLCFTRALEILEKGISLRSTGSEQEMKSLEFLDSFGMDRVSLKTALMKSQADIKVSGRSDD